MNLTRLIYFSDQLHLYGFVLFFCFCFVFGCFCYVLHQRNIWNEYLWYNEILWHILSVFKKYSSNERQCSSTCFENNLGTRCQRPCLVPLWNLISSSKRFPRVKDNWGKYCNLQMFCWQNILCLFLRSQLFCSIYVFKCWLGASIGRSTVGWSDGRQ